MGKEHFSINSLNYETTKDEEENDCKNTLFFGLFDDSESTRLRSGSMKRQYSDMGDSYHRVYEEHGYDDDCDDEEGSSMEVKVLMVLEYMRELYVGQLELLKKMFPGGAKDEFLGFFNKIGDAMSEMKQDSRTPVKSMAMQRSLSAGSQRITLRGLNLGPDLRDERFKVTTVDAGNPPPAGGAAGGGGGQGSSAAAGQGQGIGQTKK